MNVTLCHVVATRRTPTQERSRQRVADIIEAAFALVREGGIERCTMAALAVEAGLTPPSLYRYFPDASAVIRAVAEQSLDALHVAVAANLEGVDSAATARAALHRTFHDYYRAFADDRALRELWAGTFASPELVSLNVADSRRNGELIARRVGPWSGLDPETLRLRAFLLAHLTGSGIGLVLHAEPNESAGLLREAERLIDNLFDDRWDQRPTTTGDDR